MFRKAAAIAASVIGLSFGAVSLADAAPTRPTAVVDCHVYAYYPNVLISSARAISCRSAALDMRRYKRSIYRRFSTPGGFRCIQQSGVPEGGQWRCVRGGQAYRFEFGD